MMACSIGCAPDDHATGSDVDAADLDTGGGADAARSDARLTDPALADSALADSGSDGPQADSAQPDSKPPDAMSPDVDRPDAGRAGADPLDVGPSDAVALPDWWRPAVGATWHIQLTGDLDEGRASDMYLVDLFDTPVGTIRRLHASGRAVVCYVSVGSLEDWRADADRFPDAAIGDPLDGWPGERWLDVRDVRVRAALVDRLELAVEKGCDGIDPDNVDGYTHPTGFDLGPDDQLAFNRWLARRAHAYGLGVGLKNDIAQVDELVDHFDWSTNEECTVYDECDLLLPFIDAGKPVFHIEYADDVASGPARADEVCPLTAPLGFSTVIKLLDVDAWALDCAGWSPLSDAGPPDAGLPDAEVRDAGVPDADAPDARPNPPDTEIPDAGGPEIDAAVPDGWWVPAPGTTWQWQLTGDIEFGIDVAMYDVDLFEVPAAQIAQLRAAGHVVICYFSAGSHEDWRADADAFPNVAIGDPLDEWPGERWLDVRSLAVRAAQAARLDLAVEKGCDGVEPDNVDGYVNPTGFDLEAADQLDFNRWLAREAHARQLSIGLKNDVDQVGALVADFDWALNEECVSYDECEILLPFIEAGKAVFHVEYVDEPEEGPDLAREVCPQTAPLGLSTLIKTWDLDPWLIACDVERPEPSISAPDASLPDVSLPDSGSLDAGVPDVIIPDQPAADAGLAPAWWRPVPGVTWQWQMTLPIDTSVDAEAFVVDLFHAPDAAFTALGDRGRVIVCQFSAGTREVWRDDADDFPVDVQGLGIDGDDEEVFVDIRDPRVLALALARLDVALARGCDAVAPSNVDLHGQDTGFDIGAGDQLEFSRALANAAHERGLSVGLVNDLDHTAVLADVHDWALNLECFQYEECDALTPFINAGRAVLHVEFVDAEADGPAAVAEICSSTVELGLSTIVKRWDLDPWQLACPDPNP